ncbi:hypothetical protein HN446_03335 [bacterium]|nr:hypothetical protein [bacterium]
MLKTLKKVFYCPIACILFAIYPLLRLWSYNWEEAFAQELIFLLVISTIGSFILYNLFLFLLQEKQKATLGTLLFLIMFSSFEWFFFHEDSLFLYLNQIKVFDYTIFGYETLLSLWVLIFLTLMFFVFKTSKKIKIINNLLTIAACILVLTTIIRLSPFIKLKIYPYIYDYATTEHKHVFENKQLDKVIPKKDLKEGYLPDIYYIILDGYARADILKVFYDHDTKEFTGFLKNNGFFIADKSCTNYSFTLHSIPSSINMSYIPFDEHETLSHASFQRGAQQIQTLIRNPKFRNLYEFLCNSDLIFFLKKQGYFFINIAGDSFTARLKNFDITLNQPQFSLGPFTNMFVNKTFLGPLVNNTKTFKNLYDFFVPDKNIITSGQLSSLKNVPKIIKEKGKPTFTFCHILTPHHPYTFDENGNIVQKPNRKVPYEEFKKQYINEIKGINKKAQKVVETILRKSKRPPVIIIQADHGTASYKEYFETGHGLYSDALVKERMTILNAYHIPGKGNELLNNQVTPVNSFRIVLNYLFNTNLPILTDKCHFMTLADFDNNKQFVTYSAEEINKMDIVEMAKKTIIIK